MQTRSWSVIIILIVVCCIGSVSVRAQSSFQKALYVKDDSGYLISSIQRSPDGTIVGVGSNISYYGPIFLMKVDTSGNARWLETIQDGSSKGRVAIESLSILSDNTIAVGGMYTRLDTNPSWQVPILALFNERGEVLWCRKFPSILDVVSASVLGLRDSSLLLYGSINNSNGYFIKVDRNGSLLWSRRFPGGSFTSTSPLNTAFQSNDTTILVTFTMAAPSLSSLGTCIASLTTNGHPIAVHEYKSPSHLAGIILRPFGANRLFVGGSASLPNGKTAPMVMSLSSDGHPEWAHTVDPFGSSSMLDMVVDDSGVATILAISSPSSPEQFVMRVDTSGVLRTIAHLDGRSTEYSVLTPLSSGATFELSKIESSDNGRYFDCSTITPSGLGCNMNSVLGQVHSIEVTDSILSYTLINNPTVVSDLPLLAQSETWTISTLCEKEEVRSIITEQAIRVYPNPAPADAFITIVLPEFTGIEAEIVLHDLTGREVYRTHREAANSGEQIQIPTAGLASGVYTVELDDANSFAKVWRGKVVVE